MGGVMTPNQKDAANILAKLSVVAEAPAAQIGASSGQGKPGHKILEGTLPERARTHSHWRRRFTEAWNDEYSLGKAVGEAEQELHDLQHAPPIDERTEESPEALARRICQDGEGFTIAECAVAFRTTHKAIIAARFQDARDTVDGRPLKEHVDSDVDRLVTAARLRGMGASYKSIGQRLGMSGEGVRKMLGKKAA